MNTQPQSGAINTEDQARALRTQDQARAEAAFECVNRVWLGKNTELKKKYSTQCRRLPQLIQQCGLCQTVAFLSSKPTDAAFSGALKDFAEVVATSARDTDTTVETFAKRTRELPVREYQWLSRHALQCASWMKRYAEALLPKEDQNG
ncbi:MAG: type III-B CRISPR module-associated protein Cmr5 [Bryobacterales bacterium]|nr:type III-B CRISPR module-associated protein Cmr5 [Bryobacterales bacterium]